MSFKLYLLDRLGVIKSTKKMDRHRNEVWDYFQQYIDLKKSDEFANFLAIEKEINSEEFAQTKKAAESLKYKGSHVQLKTEEFERLLKNSKLAGYNKLVDSDDFKRFKELESSYLIKEFKLAKAYAEEEFEGDKKRFDAQNADGKQNWEESKPFQKFRIYEETLKTDDVQFWINYDKSKDYGLYKEMVNSPERIHFEELKREVESEKFQEQKAFFESPDRWKLTPEGKRYEVYQNMCKDELFAQYLKFRKDEDFNFFIENNCLISDHFSEGKFDTNAWHLMSSFAQKNAGFMFSHATDLHGHNAVKNVTIDHETLRINTETVPVESKMWSGKVGFVSHTFNYSSAAISHQTPVNAKSGMLEAKVKFYATKKLVDLIYLTNESETFRLNLLEMGAHTQVSCFSAKNQAQKSIKGLRQGKNYIFKMEWNENTVTWWVNNYKLLEHKIEIPNEQLYLNLRTIVVGEKPKTPHQLQVDWINLFTK
ncbi:MAG: hypothetical protein ACK5IJ_05660 [Mangrovibacterium sp.]